MHLKETVSILSLKYEINWTINIKVGDFFLGGGLFTPYRPPRRCFRGSPARKFSKGGGSAQIVSLRGVRPLRDIYGNIVLTLFSGVYIYELG